MSDLGAAGADVFYAIHWSEEFRTRYYARRVMDKEKFLARQRQEHAERGGVVEELTEAEWLSLGAVHKTDRR